MRDRGRDRKKSVFIALIHNNNVKRNTYIRPHLEKLQDVLSKQFKIKLIEISYQPKIKPHTRLMLFLRDIMYFKLNRDWLRYRSLKPWFLLLDIASFLKRALKTKRYNQGSSFLYSSAVEIVLTDKHIRAWQIFLDMGGDYLICFEDDAVFKDDSIQRVYNLLDFTSRSNENKSTYIDLAGGCNFKDFELNKLETHRDDSFKYYNKPITNTACVYLLSRPLVDRFVDLLLKKPWLRFIGADWMMNRLFLLLIKSGMHCDCMHSQPTIFKHGSMTGKYVSTFQIRQ
jgi:hypothetical protein